MIVVGLDLSLTSTGIAIVNPYAGTVKVDRITSKPPKTGRHPKTGKALPPTLEQRADRLASLLQQIFEVAEVADLVVIEGPSYGQARQTGEHDRSGLWWAVVDCLRMSGSFRIAEVAPATRIKYALGIGRGDKDKVLAAAINRYRHLVELTGNDVADATVLAAMGARHLGQPIEESLPQTHIAAMSAVRWPDTRTEAAS